MIRDDWFLRQLQEAIEATARAFLHVAAADRESAQAELEDAYAGLLGHNRSLLDVVDTTTLARLLATGDAVRALARASHADAALRRTTGDEHGARRCVDRARALAAWAREHAPDPDDDALANELHTGAA